MASRLPFAQSLLHARQYLNPVTSASLPRRFSRFGSPRANFPSSSLRRSFQTLPTRTRPQARLQFPRNHVRQPRRPFSDSKAPPPPPPAPPAPPSFSARMRQLSREYGYTAVGVYFALSALDFPFCFLAVRAFGTDRIAALEHTVIDGIKRGVGYVVPSLGEKWEAQRLERAAEEAKEEAKEVVAQENGGSEGATLGTQLALAYVVHKSFIFLRVPLTAAVLPKVVKKLRSWGWDVGKRKPKVPKTSA